PPPAHPSDSAVAPAARVGALLDRLDRLADEQADALSAGDDDRLLRALGEKQSALQAIDLPGLLRASGAERGRDFKRRIATLLERDGESLRTATARRDELAGELSALGSARAARGAYGEAEPAAATRGRLNVAG
ncbi:MAG: hypothetical protein AAF907_11885, partial [Planctomycetota bacterium]